MDDRRGNPSDPAEEAERVRKAMENLENWGKKYGGEFAGGVTMKSGSGKQYDVQIGDAVVSQKITSRTLPAPEEIKAIEPEKKHE